MNRLRQEENNQDSSGASEGGLEPEDHAPAAVGYDYAADEGALTVLDFGCVIMERKQKEQGWRYLGRAR